VADDVCFLPPHQSRQGSRRIRLDRNWSLAIRGSKRAESLLTARVVLRREFNHFDRQVRALARADHRAHLFMSVPGVGPIVAFTLASAIDDLARFTSSKRVGPYFGSTPRKYQSGETDIDGRISKIGDASARANLYEAANVILTKPLKGCRALKSWATKLARRAGPKKAKVALAHVFALGLCDDSREYPREGIVQT
jgi:transposase